MTFKRTALRVLSRVELLEVGRVLSLDWQSFRLRKSKCEAAPPGIAARATDVFGNDGIATVKVMVR